VVGDVVGRELEEVSKETDFGRVDVEVDRKVVVDVVEGRNVVDGVLEVVEGDSALVGPAEGFFVGHGVEWLPNDGVSVDEGVKVVGESKEGLELVGGLWEGDSHDAFDAFGVV